MNRTQLRKEVLSTVPPFYRRIMGKFAQTITSMTVDATLQAIMDATLEGEKVEIHGFGSFDTSVRAPHLVYCNLSSEPTYKVTRPYIRVYLRPCAAWKNRLAQSVADQFEDLVAEKKKLAEHRSNAHAQNSRTVSLSNGGKHGEVRV